MFWTFFVILCGVDLCRADVTIDVTSVVNKTNTDQDLSIKVYYTATTAGEVNDATCGWKTTQTQSFEYYYMHVYVPGVGDIRITNSDIEWNPIRTPEELINAGGEVMCTALLDGQPKASKDFTINIHSKQQTISTRGKPGMATVLQSPAASADIIRYSTLIMTCSGDKGNPTGSVTWKINGTEMTDDTYKTDTITINAVQAEHNGDWTCYFTNDLGSGGESEIQTVQVKWMPESCSLVLNPDDDYIILGRTLILTCTCSDKGKPIGEINWVLNGIKKTGNMYQGDVITIDSVESQHAGDWECYYKNAIGTGTPSSKTIDIKYRSNQPELTIDTDVELIRLGDKVTLDCMSKDRGHPEGHPVWLKDNVIIEGDQYSSHTVTFTAVDGSVNGVWNCYYSNEVGNSSLSNAVEIDVKCLPMIHMEFITYEFGSYSVDFNLKIRNPLAAKTLNILMCTNISCNKATTKIEESVNQNVELPEASTSDVYNVTFTFVDEYGIVTQHGIALKGAVKQNQIPTILAVLLGILFAAAVVTIASLVYVFYWRHRIKGVTTQADTAIQYVNVGSVAHSGGITNTATSQEYEDVATANAANSQTAENTNYMDLNQTDIQQTRNRPAELTVYQSLNGTQ